MSGPNERETPEPFDASRHLASAAWNNPMWYLPEPPDGSDPPVPLDADVERWRAEIEAGRAHEPSVRVSRSTAVLSHERATVIAALLRELSKRTRPGFSCDPIVSTGAISALAEELADDLWNRAS